MIWWYELFSLSITVLLIESDIVWIYLCETWLRKLLDISLDKISLISIILT